MGWWAYYFCCFISKCIFQAECVWQQQSCLGHSDSIRFLEGTVNWLSKHVVVFGVTKITPGQICPPDHGALLPGALSGIGRSTVAVQKNVTPEMALIFHYSYRSISSRRANYSTSERAWSDKGKGVWIENKCKGLEVHIISDDVEVGDDPAVVFILMKG